MLYLKSIVHKDSVSSIKDVNEDMSRTGLNQRRTSNKAISSFESIYNDPHSFKWAILMIMVIIDQSLSLQIDSWHWMINKWPTNEESSRC